MTLRAAERPFIRVNLPYVSSQGVLSFESAAVLTMRAAEGPHLGVFLNVLCQGTLHFTAILTIRAAKRAFIRVNLNFVFC